MSGSSDQPPVCPPHLGLVAVLAGVVSLGCSDLLGLDEFRDVPGGGGGVGGAGAHCPAITDDDPNLYVTVPLSGHKVHPDLSCTTDDSSNGIAVLKFGADDTCTGARTFTGQGALMIPSARLAFGGSAGFVAGVLHSDMEFGTNCGSGAEVTLNLEDGTSSLFVVRVDDGGDGQLCTRAARRIDGLPSPGGVGGTGGEVASLGPTINDVAWTKDEVALVGSTGGAQFSSNPDSGNGVLIAAYDHCLEQGSLIEFGAGSDNLDRAHDVYFHDDEIRVVGVVDSVIQDDPTKVETLGCSLEATGDVGGGTRAFEMRVQSGGACSALSVFGGSASATVPPEYVGALGGESNCVVTGAAGITNWSHTSIPAGTGDPSGFIKYGCDDPKWSARWSNNAGLNETGNPTYGARVVDLGAGEVIVAAMYQYDDTSLPNKGIEWNCEGCDQGGPNLLEAAAFGADDISVAVGVLIVAKTDQNGDITHRSAIWPVNTNFATADDYGEVALGGDTMVLSPDGQAIYLLADIEDGASATHVYADSTNCTNEVTGPSLFKFTFDSGSDQFTCEWAKQLTE